MGKDRRSPLVGNDVLLLNYDQYMDAIGPDMRNACATLSALCSEPRGSAFHQLQQFRKLVPIVIHGFITQTEALDGAAKQLDRIVASSEAKRFKRWTPEEEEYLIELVVRDTPVLEISTILGRSAGAVKNKVSDLVGIKRISQTVAGRFFGTLNGETVTGTIEGTVQKV